MADHFTAILDFRHFTVRSNFLPLNRHTSAFNGYRRSFHLNLLAKSSSSSPSPSNFDVISTHEHSDGSLLFKFGDPAEVTKNLKTEQFEIVEEVAENLGNDGNSSAKGLSKHDEAVTVASKSIESEEGDETNSGAMITETIDFEQENNGSNEKLLEGLNGVEIPFSIDNDKMDFASPGVDIEEDISNFEKAVGQNRDGMDSANMSVVDKGSEEGNVGSNEDFSIKENDGLDTLVSATDESVDSIHLSAETEIQNETIKVGAEAPSSEPEMDPCEVIEDQNLQLGEGTGSDTIDLIVPEVQDVVLANENMLDTNVTDARLFSNPTAFQDQGSEIETGFQNEILNEVKQVEPLLKESVANTMGKSREDIGAKIQTSNFILGLAGTVHDSNVPNDDLVEASAYESRGMKSIDSFAACEDVSVPDLTLSSGAALLPHPSKVLAGGEEDAYFIAGQTWFGVADGVSCWPPKGTSHVVFAKELARTCERLVSSVNNVAELLDLSVSETRAPGSATILVAHFDGQALHVANIGDSGFIILRHGTVYRKSSPMYHAFHFPLQVEQSRDKLSSQIAEFYKVDLEEGDVIITATDGLYDNLYDQEIASTVAKSFAAGKSLDEIAEALAKSAQANGGCAYGRSPFADDAQAAGYRGYTGGKLDDVAVIVSVVRMQSAYESSG